MVKLVKGQNDLLSQYPACINEWDFNKNHPLSPDAAVAGSSKKVWWICCKGHSYEQSINLHVGRGYGCPYCSHRKVLTGYNDLETLFPGIATEWHPYKNAELKPSSITAYSKKKVWWLCSRGHSYEQTVERRTRRGSACYYCSGHKVLKGFNDLASVNPSLSVEWHPSKNAPLTPYEVTAGSGKRVWWLCPIGHEYQATIHDRNTDNTQCRHGRDRTVAAGGDAGSFIGKGQNAFQFVHRQGVQLFLAEFGQSRPKEGIACAVGVAHLAGDACHMTSFLPKAVEYAVCTQGDKNQSGAVLCQLCRATFAVGGAGEQGQFFIGHFQDIH